MHVHELEDKVVKLEEEVHQKNSIVTQLQAENTTLKDQLESLKNLLAGALPRPSAMRAYFVLLSVVLIVPTCLWYANPYLPASSSNSSLAPSSTSTSTTAPTVSSETHGLSAMEGGVSGSGGQPLAFGQPPPDNRRSGRVLLWCDCNHPPLAGATVDDEGILVMNGDQEVVDEMNMSMNMTMTDAEEVGAMSMSVVDSQNFFMCPVPSLV